MARRRHVAKIDRNRATIAHSREAMASRLASFLRAKRHHVAASIVSAITTAEKVAKAESLSDEERQRLIDRVQAATNLGDWGALVPEVTRLLTAVTVDGIAAGFGQIGERADLTDLVNEQAVAWAEARAAELVGMRVEGGRLVENPDAEWRIDEGTRTLLRGDIADAIDEGLSTAELADHLTGSYAFSDDRADTIARTEMAHADVAGNLLAYRDSGVVEGKEWVLGSEHDDDDECDEAAAMGVVPLDSDFGGTGDPPAHPRCVCDVFPVVMDSADTEE
jgi:hypothetical protein